MKCPSCSAECGDGAAECPACGLIFAKWRERREKEKDAALHALAALAGPSSPAPTNPWLTRGAAAAFVLAWILILAVYVRRHAPKRAPALGADTGQFVEVRDPKTGDMRRMPIRRMAGTPAPPGQ
ncbi:MAG TPA: hypothetical protein VH309_10745 [Elusimicrobiota bacterium]|jgi:hypothetical protein|nr:hypothetical protein [Elusimicrobiota bacterium]